MIVANGAEIYILVLTGEMDSDGHFRTGRAHGVSSPESLRLRRYSRTDMVMMIKKRSIMNGKMKFTKPDFSDEDGIRAAELEGECGEMGGWTESDAETLHGLGVPRFSR